MEKFCRAGLAGTAARSLGPIEMFAVIETGEGTRVLDINVIAVLRELILNQRLPAVCFITSRLQVAGRMVTAMARLVHETR
jgi:hypothetical protein